MIETGQIDRVIQQLMGTAQWRRIKMHIQGLEHDADKEALFVHIRKALSANLVEFRNKEK